MYLSSCRFLREKINPAALGRRFAAALIALAVVTCIVAVRPAAAIPVAAPQPSCDVICDGWLNASVP